MLPSLTLTWLEKKQPHLSRKVLLNILSANMAFNTEIAKCVEITMYRLNIGCIQNGRITSRDSEVREFETLEECKQSYQASRDFWRSIGYQVWFADVYKDGEKVNDWK